MPGHHSSKYHFLIKLQQALAYLQMEPKAPSNKLNHYKGKHAYNNRTITSDLCRMRASSPRTRSTLIIVLDVVDDDHDVFTPDIINSVDVADGKAE